MSYLPWLSLGAAGVALGGAGYFELSSKRAEGDARNALGQAAALGHIDDMQSAQSTARVLVGVSAVFALTGGVLFWVRSTDSAEPAELALGCSGVMCTLEGAF